MKNMNNEKLLMKILKKFTDILIKSGDGQEGCFGIFTYETEIPMDVLLNEKEKYNAS